MEEDIYAYFRAVGIGDAGLALVSEQAAQWARLLRAEGYTTVFDEHARAMLRTLMDGQRGRQSPA